MWAGAHVRPIPTGGSLQLKREGEWSKYTVQKFDEIASKEPWAGISCLMAVEYLASPSQNYLTSSIYSGQGSFYHATGLRNYRLLSAEERPKDIEWASSMIHIASIRRCIV